jgi:hypothetical protein
LYKSHHINFLTLLQVVADSINSLDFDRIETFVKNQSTHQTIGAQNNLSRIHKPKQNAPQAKQVRPLWQTLRLVLSSAQNHLDVIFF